MYLKDDNTYTKQVPWISKDLANALGLTGEERAFDAANLIQHLVRRIRVNLATQATLQVVWRPPSGL